MLAKGKVRRGVAIRLNLMPLDYYLQSEEGRRAAKHVLEGTLTDEETGKQITFTGAHKLLEAIYELQKRKTAQYKKGLVP
jgi:transposase-like protein